jgi:hypothetical protein
VIAVGKLITQQPYMAKYEPIKAIVEGEIR